MEDTWNYAPAAAAGGLGAPGRRLADVGTDHGYLPVWLLLQRGVSCHSPRTCGPGRWSAPGHTRRPTACDGMDFRLCDGLPDIAPDECDTVVIAGMGGENIAAILEACRLDADGAHTLLLQPMTRRRALR